MTLLFTSLFRALFSQLHIRMLMLTLLPLVIGLGLWGLLLWQGLQPLIDQIHQWFSQYSLFQSVGSTLDAWGLSAIRSVMVPLLAMWLLLPLMILSALVLVSALAMPAIGRHVATHHYPQLEMRHGGSFAGSLWVSVSSFILFLVIWLLTLPLNLVPLLALFIQPLLWGWLTSRVMAYDALADFADHEERRALLVRQRWPLLAIGVATGSLGAIPSLLWLGGVISVILFPLLAALAIWLYLLVFVFSGLWFQHYCLDALARLRSTPLSADHPGRIIDIN
jgi:hypothetical protein